MLATFEVYAPVDAIHRDSGQTVLLPFGEYTVVENDDDAPDDAITCVPQTSDSDVYYVIADLLADFGYTNR